MAHGLISLAEIGTNMDKPKKSLGQHWLQDETVLRQIASYGELTPDDTVVEIGPGLGTLTEILDEQAGKVIAVEYDEALASKLSSNKSFSSVEVVNADFLDCDLSGLPVGYKVVGNIPYYITSKIVRKLMTDANKPSITVLLVQKEVAERLAAKPGEMSLLAVSAQLYAEVSLGAVVGSELFTPPPKVDSQVVILKTHRKPLFADLDKKLYFRIVKAGFSARRKKMRTALAGGMDISVAVAEEKLRLANIDPNLRAQALNLSDWHRLMIQFKA